MFFYEGYVCPVCKQKFQEQEDIVACPDCGAPHHRSCWKQEGQCSYAQDHGTTRQWKRPEEPSVKDPPNVPVEGTGQVRTCSRCGKVNPEFAEFCARCGMGLKPPDWKSGAQNTNPSGSQYRGGIPFQGRYGEYAPYHMPIMDPFGGVSHDEKIDDIAAEDVVTFVGPNSAYYLPRFYKMQKDGSNTSWNWIAFLLTPYWLLYRKNYLAGGIVLFLSLVESILNSYIMFTFIQPALDTTTDSAMFESIYTLVNSGQYNLYFTIIFLLLFISLLVRIMFGVMGNSIYKHTMVGRIKKIGEKTGFNGIIGNNGSRDTSVASDFKRELTTQGGVSLVLVAIAAGIVWFGQTLFQALIM